MIKYKSNKISTGYHAAMVILAVAFISFSSNNFENYKNAMQFFVPLDFTYQAVMMLNHIFEREKYNYTFRQDSLIFKAIVPIMSCLEVFFNKNLRRGVTLYSNYQSETSKVFLTSLLGMTASMLIQIFAENKFKKIEKSLENLQNKTQADEFKEKPLGIFSNFSMMIKAFLFNIAKYQPEDVLDFKPVVENYNKGGGPASMFISFFYGLGKMGNLAFFSANALGILEDGERMIEAQKAEKIMQENAMTHATESPQRDIDFSQDSVVVGVSEPIKAVLIDTDFARNKPIKFFVENLQNQTPNVAAQER